MEVIFRELTGENSWDYMNRRLIPTLGGKRWKAILKHREGETAPGWLRIVGPCADAARWGYLWLNKGQWKKV